MSSNRYADACKALEMPLEDEQRIGTEAISRAQVAGSLTASYSIDDMRALIHAIRIMTQMGAIAIAFGEASDGLKLIKSAQDIKALLIVMAVGHGLIEDES